MRKTIALAAVLAAALSLPAAAQTQPPPGGTQAPTGGGTTTPKGGSTATQGGGSSAGGSQTQGGPPDWAPATGYREKMGSSGGTADNPGQSKKKNK